MQYGFTVCELFYRVFKAHWNKERFIRSGWAIEVERLYARHLDPKFGRIEATSLKTSEIREWHLSLVDTPIAANRALEVLTKMYSYAEELEWLPAGTNPAKRIKAHKERTRKRFATPVEIGKLAAILQRESNKNPRAVAFIYILLFSGARPRSIERSTWNELQIVEHEGKRFGVVTFNGKSTQETGEQEQVIIPPQALTLLSQPKDKSETLLGIKMPKDFWTRIRKEAGCEDLWARDLRRTFSVIGLSNGVEAGVIGELLNHKNASTTKRYLGLLQDKRLEAAGEIANRIGELLRGAK